MLDLTYDYFKLSIAAPARIDELQCKNNSARVARCSGGVLAFACSGQAFASVRRAIGFFNDEEEVWEEVHNFSQQARSPAP